MVVFPGKSPDELPAITNVEDTDGMLVWNPNSANNIKLQLATWATVVDWLQEYFLNVDQLLSTSEVTVDFDGEFVRLYTGSPGVPVLSLSSIASLKALPIPSTPQVVYVSGYYSTNDGGGGLFCWDSTDRSSTAAGYIRPDDGIIIAPDVDSTGASGCWIRQFTGRTVNVLWYGCKRDGITNDGERAQKALYYATQTNNMNVYFPAGEYFMTSYWVTGDKGSITLNPNRNSQPWYRYATNDTYERWSALFTRLGKVGIIGDGAELTKLTFNSVSIVDNSFTPGNVRYAVRGGGIYCRNGSITVKGIHLNGDAPPTTDPAFNANFYCHNSASYGPLFDICWDFSHKGILFNIDGIYASGYYLSTLEDVYVNNWRGENVYEGTSASVANNRLNIVRCRFDGSHASMISGTWELTMIDSYLTNTYTNAYESVTEKPIRVIGCRFVECQTGFNHVGYINTRTLTELPLVIKDCTFENCGKAIYIAKQVTAGVSSIDNFKILNNYFWECENGVELGLSSTSGLVTIEGNTFEVDQAVAPFGIRTRTGTVYKAVIRNNTFKSYNTSGVVLTDIELNPTDIDDVDVVVADNFYSGTTTIKRNTDGAATGRLIKWKGNKSHNIINSARNFTISASPPSYDSNHTRINVSSGSNAAFTITLPTTGIPEEAEWVLIMDYDKDAANPTTRHIAVFEPGRTDYWVPRRVVLYEAYDTISFLFKDGAWRCTDIGSSFPNFITSGTTANRPVPGNLRQAARPFVDGFQYFDTTLGKPIWWKHSTLVWVDATGATV